MEYLYETHMHTSEVSGCADSSAEQQVIAYKKRGYTGIIITDHFINGFTSIPKRASWEETMRDVASGYREAKRAGDKCGLDVFFGWEYTIRGADFLTYGLDLDFLISHPGLDKLIIEKYSAIVRENGGYLAQAHPYRSEYYIEHNYPTAPHLLDGVEVFNSMDYEQSNEKALAFAEKHGLAMQAGTDSHNTGNRRHRGGTVHYSGVALKKRAQTIHDLIDAIKTKNIRLI